MSLNKATVERSDPTALPAAGVVMEAVVATVLATEVLENSHPITWKN